MSAVTRFMPGNQRIDTLGVHRTHGDYFRVVWSGQAGQSSVMHHSMMLQEANLSKVGIL